MAGKMTSHQLHATEDHSGFSGSARDGHHVRDIEEAISVSVKLELAAGQSVCADRLGWRGGSETQVRLNVDASTASHGNHVRVKTIAVRSVDIANRRLLQSLEGSKAAG